jgi:hypothetical protein
MGVKIIIIIIIIIFFYLILGCCHIGHLLFYFNKFLIGLFFWIFFGGITQVINNINKKKLFSRRLVKI